MCGTISILFRLPSSPPSSTLLQRLLDTNVALQRAVMGTPHFSEYLPHVRCLLPTPSDDTIRAAADDQQGAEQQPLLQVRMGGVGL